VKIITLQQYAIQGLLEITAKMKEVVSERTTRVWAGGLLYFSNWRSDLLMGYEERL
jgi:hypothetical protein